MDSDLERLVRLFSFIRDNIFTNHSYWTGWDVAFVDFSIQGQLCPDERLVKVSSAGKNWPDLLLEETLVHELCHHASMDHDEPWFEAMYQAEHNADLLGREDLANKILLEIRAYKSGSDADS
jgi:hypothetical protein